MQKESFPAHTVVTVPVLPLCDFCKMRQREYGFDQALIEFAQYDGKTVAGPWANMCEHHFGNHGVGLGLGKGQRLVMASIIPTEICAEDDCGKPAVVRLTVRFAQYGFCAAHGAQVMAETLGTALVEKSERSPLDMCRVCGKVVTDFEDGGYESESGQRGHFACDREADRG